MGGVGFDSALYREKQSERILERIQNSKGKLYMEFGGKLFDDLHAARVLPGYEPEGKIELLQSLREQAEIILCINAQDIEKNKIRADMGITYDLDVLRLIDALRERELSINSVVITQYEGQSSADIFRKKLKNRGEKVFIHCPTKGYPTDIAVILSKEGYGANPYIPTSRPLVVVTAPGPGSGKLATCLSQIYHEHERGQPAGYAKFETFPIWNLPITHPVNLAYEAATADLDDVNMIDPYHLEAYNQSTVNYNRDIEVFPIIQTILSRTTGYNVYKSPTDMGVNMVGFCITDDEAVREAARGEVLRRHYRIRRDWKLGRVDLNAVKKIEIIMGKLGLTPDDRPTVAAALKKASAKNAAAVAVALPDGKIVTGRATEHMNAPAGAVVNAIKRMAGIAAGMHIISPVVLEPIVNMKKNNLGARNPTLNLEEVLICLSICAATNPMVEEAMNMLVKLRGCEAHATYILADTDETVLHKLGINITCEPVFPGKELYSE